jgi:hypothetical protein
MDTRTGEIHHGEKAINEAMRVGKNLTELTPPEVTALQGVPEIERPLRLALFRFRAERKRLGANVSTEVLNAFRLGYKAAEKDLK